MNTIARRMLFAIIAIALLAAAAVIFRPTPITVDATLVTVGPMRLTVEEEGKTRIRERYVISSPLTGRLRRIALDPGDPVVATTTPVAVIEPTSPDLLDPRAIAEADARVRSAEAAVRRAESLHRGVRVAYDFAETELGRIGAAAVSGAANERELDEARTDERAASEALRTASYEEEIARFELDVARSALLYARGETHIDDDPVGMVLQSPIDGVVLRVFRESVAVVGAGEPLLEVGDAGDLEIVIDVLSDDGVRIAPGDRVIIDHWGGDKPLDAIVRLVEPSAYTEVSALGIEEQRVNVVADFSSPLEDRRRLGDQFRVEASIVIWESPSARQVPSSAVFRTGDDWSVFAIINERAELRPIEIGRRNGRSTQVLSGLETGDCVVLHPNDKLDAGARVRVRGTE